VRLFAEEGIDSRALDTSDGWESWKADEGLRFVDGTYLDLNAKPANVDRLALIQNNLNGLFPVATRDGGVRLTESSFDVLSVEGLNADGLNYLNIEAEATVSYRWSDEAVIDSYLRANPGTNAGQIVAARPTLGDEKPNDLRWTIDVRYALTPTSDSSWKTVGFNTDSESPLDNTL
jgi:hypothetical protein